MARIRTIKPEFWQDEKLAPLRPIDRLVFLGLISHADDAGRLVDNVKLLDGLIFPLTEDTCRDALETLARLSRVTRYTSASGQALLQVTNWEKHQRVDKPAKYVLPAPTLTQSSGESREDVARVSRESRAPTYDLRPPTVDQRPTTTNPREDDDFAAVVADWEQASGRITSPMLQDQMRDAIEGYGVERVRKAIGITAKAGATSFAYVEGVLRKGGDERQDGNGNPTFPPGHPAHGHVPGQEWEDGDSRFQLRRDSTLWRADADAPMGWRKVDG